MTSLFDPLSILVLVILVFSAILHEIAHGYVAERLGDPTARLLGRLTLNPLPHIDLFLSIILPLLLFLSHSGVIFGGAKPVPVDPYNLRDGRKDMALVSLAGPLTNVLLTLVAFGVFKIVGLASANIILAFLGVFALLVIKVNLSLAIFNLLPIPPLDGSKIFALVLPEKLADSYLSLSSFGTLILLFLLVFPIGGFSLMGIVSSVFLFCLHLLGL
ncbi:MAG TPA: site-2 protease family protein [Patescibacteria group bacterium]|nr:site-2 protease family protein [Patescibacteria group bacterium]